MIRRKFFTAWPLLFLLTQPRALAATPSCEEEAAAIDGKVMVKTAGGAEGKLSTANPGALCQASAGQKLDKQTVNGKAGVPVCSATFSQLKKRIQEYGEALKNQCAVFKAASDCRQKNDFSGAICKVDQAKAARKNLKLMLSQIQQESAILLGAAKKVGEKYKSSGLKGPAVDEIKAAEEAAQRVAAFAKDASTLNDERLTEIDGTGRTLRERDGNAGQLADSQAAARQGRGLGSSVTGGNKPGSGMDALSGMMGQASKMAGQAGQLAQNMAGKGQGAAASAMAQPPAALGQQASLSAAGSAASVAKTAKSGAVAVALSSVGASGGAAPISGTISANSRNLSNGAASFDRPFGQPGGAGANTGEPETGSGPALRAALLAAGNNSADGTATAAGDGKASASGGGAARATGSAASADLEARVRKANAQAAAAKAVATQKLPLPDPGSGGGLFDGLQGGAPIGPSLPVYARASGPLATPALSIAQPAAPSVAGRATLHDSEVKLEPFLGGAEESLFERVHHTHERVQKRSWQAVGMN